MAGIYLNRFEGSRGEIRIPSLGIVVARLTKPVLLRRREGATHELGAFDLHAAVSYFNQHLWDDPEYEKTTQIWLAKVPLKVLWRPGTVLVRPDQKTLRMEGVEPEWREPEAPASPT